MEPYTGMVIVLNIKTINFNYLIEIKKNIENHSKVDEWPFRLNASVGFQDLLLGMASCVCLGICLFPMILGGLQHVKWARSFKNKLRGKFVELI